MSQDILNELVIKGNYEQFELKLDIGNRQLKLPVFVGKFWDDRQRQSNPIHEIPYRGCFKSELPKFYIERLTNPGDIVYDPFMGRGTTLIEAALLDRVPYGSDVLDLSLIYVLSRLWRINKEAIISRILDIDLSREVDINRDLLVFYEQRTLEEVTNLKNYFLSKGDFISGMDDIDRWLLMVTLTRLSGHSDGFFSNYTLPPNQCVSIESQKKINNKYKTIPLYRSVKQRIIKKTKQMLSACDDRVIDNLERAGNLANITKSSAKYNNSIKPNSVSLAIMSPPFLNLLSYSNNNWLRLWFLQENGIINYNGNEVKERDNALLETIDGWKSDILEVFIDINRILLCAKYMIFEAGKVGNTCLATTAVPIAIEAGLEPVALMLTNTRFTKTAHCWGVSNNIKGTNSNRILICRKS